MVGEGKRFNEGKIRFDLIPPFAEEQVAKVLTKGAIKYGEGNWVKGMQWSKCIASLRRHLQAFVSGVDKDHETGELHLAHLAVNAMFLLEYYKIFPEGDDRQFSFHNEKKVGLDIDGVLADFDVAFLQRATEMGIEHNLERMRHWRVFYRDSELWKQICADRDFWVNLPTIEKQEELTFHPHAYVTSRSIPTEWTEDWLMKNNFPAAPVYSIPFNTDKVATLKEHGIELFVDDKFENFCSINKAGIFCLLYTQPHNEKYDVGFRRINSLKELDLWLK